MAPPLGILKPIGKVEVEQTDDVDRVETEVPLSATLCLLAYRESGIVDGAVLEELLIYVLHLDDELLTLIVLTIHVEYSTSSVGTVAKLLGVEISDILHILLTMEHGVKEADEQLLVEL